MVETTNTGRSLMNIKKSKAPSTDPWGTPDVTGSVLDSRLLTDVNCEREERNS